MPNADHAPITHVMPVHVNPASGPAPDPNAAVAEVVFVDDSGEPTDIGGGSSYVLPAATKGALGGVKQGDAIADLSAAPTQTDFNNLLAILRATGLIASA